MAQKIRAHSIDIIKVIGYPSPPLHLPLSNTSKRYLRNSAEVVNRSAALHAVVACASGFDGRKGLAWLRENGVDEALTPDEKRLLLTADGHESTLARDLETRIEGLWALCWATTYVEKLDFCQYCGDNLVTIMPDVINKERLYEYRKRAKLRSAEEIMQMEDLAYCLDWGIVESRKNNNPKPGLVRGYVIRERRHALSWLLCDDRWDEVPTDT